MLSSVAGTIADMLLTQDGTEWTYSRNGESISVTLYQSDLPPTLVDNGGSLIEVILANFRCRVGDLGSFGNPKSGDRITNGTTTYEVRPLQDKCFYTIGQLLHIHAKQVATL